MKKSDKDNTTEDDTQENSTKSKLREESLKAAGLSFLVADSALITGGLRANRSGIWSAGIFGLTAGVVGARYGHHKAERQLEELYHRLGDHLHKEGFTIPKDVDDQLLTRKGGIFDKIEDFLYKHPSQVMNVMYSAIGVQFARTGRKIGSKSLIASGGLLISGALAGILIPEKKPDPDHPPEGPLQQFWSWIQEKPLRVTGALFNANQVFLGLSAFEDRRKNPGNKNYLFTLLAVAAFSFGNTMLLLSSKSRSGNKKIDEKTLNAVADTSARIIAAQPQEVKSALLEDISQYLSIQPNIGMKKDQISGILSERIAKVPKQSQQTQPPQPSQASGQPAGNWQSRMDTSSKEVPPLPPTPSR